LPGIETDKFIALIAAYFLSFTRFQMKKDTKDTAKEMIPNVSSLGQEARCVNGQDRVSGWTAPLSTIYSQPKRPKTNNVRKTAFIIFMGVAYHFLHSVSTKDYRYISYQNIVFAALAWRRVRL